MSKDQSVRTNAGFTFVEFGIVLLSGIILLQTFSFSDPPRPENRRGRICSQRLRQIQGALEILAKRKTPVAGVLSGPVQAELLEERLLPPEFFSQPVSASCSFVILVVNGSIDVRCPYHSTLEQELEETYRQKLDQRQSDRRKVLGFIILIAGFSGAWLLLSPSQTRIAALAVFASSFTVGTLFLGSGLLGIPFWHPVHPVDRVLLLSSMGISLDAFHAVCIGLLQLFAFWWVFQTAILFGFTRRGFPQTFCWYYFFGAISAFLIAMNIAPEFPMVARALVIMTGGGYLWRTWKDFAIFQTFASANPKKS